MLYHGNRRGRSENDANGTLESPNGPSELANRSTGPGHDAGIGCDSILESDEYCPNAGAEGERSLKAWKRSIARQIAKNLLKER